MNSYNAGLTLGKDIARKWQNELSKYRKYLDNPTMPKGIQDGILSVLELSDRVNVIPEKGSNLSPTWGNLNKD